MVADMQTTIEPNVRQKLLSPVRLRLCAVIVAQNGLLEARAGTQALAYSSWRFTQTLRILLRELEMRSSLTIIKERDGSQHSDQ